MDKHIVCKECQTEFLWCENEQRFYQNKGLLPPRRCRACRERLKATVCRTPPPDLKGVDNG